MKNAVILCLIILALAQGILLYQANQQANQAQVRHGRDIAIMAVAEQYQRAYAQACLRDLKCAYTFIGPASKCSPGELERVMTDEDAGRLRKP